MVDTAKKWNIDGAGVCYAQAIGGRSCQQDAASSFRVNIEGDVTPYLIEAFRKAAARIGTLDDAGSTCTVAHISKDNILTIAYVGDSPAFLADATSKTIREITELHNVDNVHERHRIISEGGRIVDPWVVNTDTMGIPLTRGFEEPLFRQAGVIFNPEIVKIDLLQYNIQGLTIGLSSDGMLGDNDKILSGDRKGIRRVFAKDNFAEALASSQLSSYISADKIEYCDNITVLSHMLGSNSAGLVMILCDGHGRDARANDIAREICDIMQQELLANSLPQKKDWRKLSAQDIRRYELLTSAELGMECSRNTKWLERIRSEKQLLVRQ